MHTKKPPSSVSPEGAGTPHEEAPRAVDARREPSPKRFGLVALTLDRGVKTTAVGQLYGLDFEIEGDGFEVRVFFDVYNRRLKVLDYAATNKRALCDRLCWLADQNGFDKIFLKARDDDWQEFLGLGFMLEGVIKYYFRGVNAFILSRFSSQARLRAPSLIEESRLIERLFRDERLDAPLRSLPERHAVTVATEDDIPELVDLYRMVFETYPSPLTDPNYIQQTMRRNVLYRLARDASGRCVSAASADIDEKHSNAELTDCATSRDHRGKGLMMHILARLEDDLRERGIHTAYTLARAMSPGMNRAFYRLGFEYTGRLLNNCDIAGTFEDMNIWTKRLLKVG